MNDGMHGVRKYVVSLKLNLSPVPDAQEEVSLGEPRHIRHGMGYLRVDITTIPQSSCTGAKVSIQSAISMWG